MTRDFLHKLRNNESVNNASIYTDFRTYLLSQISFLLFICFYHSYLTYITSIFVFFVVISISFFCYCHNTCRWYLFLVRIVQISLSSRKLKEHEAQIHNVFAEITERMCVNVEFRSIQWDRTEIIWSCVIAYRVQSHFELGRSADQHCCVWFQNVVHFEIYFQERCFLKKKKKQH